MENRFYIKDGWKFKITNYPSGEINIPSKKLNKWLPATVPGTIHTDLLKAGLIDDPFKIENEYRYKWISLSNCEYRTEFNLPEGIKIKSGIKLVFEGIDTVADIYLNSEFLGRSENMFLRYEFNTGRLLKPEKNILKLRFVSPLNHAKKLNAENRKLTGELSADRVHLRKAQYSFGWDWGPEYPTSGIWRSVYLLSEDKAVINGINFETIKLNKTAAKVNIRFNLRLSTNQKIKAVVTLSNKTGQYRKEIDIKENNEYSFDFDIAYPGIWWPNGHGSRELYDLNVKVIDKSGNVLDEKNKKVGIRKIELQLKENNKPVFRFNVNNKTIYAKGMDWIPADSFLPGVEVNKYRKLLTFAKDSGANMIRVWGGGIYEADEFYDLCDELGLLVWQDFMFACGVYPEGKQFLLSVTREIVQNVERLKNHPCIAIWCGNNENEWIWYRERNRSYKEMPGYKIFHKIIPGLMKRLDPSRPYWPTSPFGFDADPNSQNSGNRHQWDIWSNWKDYKLVNGDCSLFVTEFGFQGPANRETFDKYLPADKREIQDPAFEYYNKQIEGPERIIRFLAGHVPIKTDFNDFIYLAQLNQGLALKTCIEHWRTNRITYGSIIWQLNDCWPVTSWSLIDSEIKPKMAYHFIKTVFSKTIIYFSKTGNRIKINLLNEEEENETVYRNLIIDSATGKYLYNKTGKAIPKKKRYIELEEIDASKLSEDKNWIIISTLYDNKNNIINRNYYSEKEWKQMKLPRTRIKYKLSKESGNNYLLLSTNNPAFFVDVHYNGITFSDRGFILLPGEEKRINIIGKGDTIKKNDVEIFCLNNYLK